MINDNRQAPTFAKGYGGAGQPGLREGTKLGPYEILAPIGAGGMGEVYKAKDTRLERTVAVKVLPSHLADKPELKQRLEREARAVSSLNHPHICTLHDIGEQEGVDYLVMEFLEGETLADRLKKGALPLDRALRHAVEIADALDKAHRQGVIHRDLKPGNIMLTTSGAKLMDFGLAKFRADVSAETSSMLSALPTEEKPLTEKGTLVGTFQYMAPEQLEAKEADTRADIFAFGAVLHEMVTGRKAFEGKSQASLITAIMGSEPPPVSQLQSMSPAALDHVVQRCLAKESDERWQTASDLMRELKWIAEGSAEAIESAPAGAASPSLWKRALAVGLAFSLVVGLIVWGLMRSETTSPAGMKRVTVRLPPTDELYLVGITGSVGISPDGSHIIYLGKRDGYPQLLLRPMDELEAVPVRGAERAFHPFFSPDGRWMGFVDSSDGWKLKKVPLTGGPPLPICDIPPLARGATWGPKDTIFFAPRLSGLWSVPAEGGSPQPIVTSDIDDKEKDYQWPHILPDGKTILVTEDLGESEGGQRIVAVKVKTGDIRILIEGGTCARYASSGHLVFQRDGSLLAVPFDPDSLEVHGPPVLVIDKVRINNSSLADYALSQNGTLVYVNDDQHPPSNLVWVDRDGHSRSLTGSRRFYQPRLSPDGNRVLVSIREEGSVSNTWLYDLVRDTLTRVTFGGKQDIEANTPAIWSPDGERVAFGSVLEGQDRHFFSMEAGGSGPVKRLTPSEGGWRSADSWSPDGKVLAYTEIPRGGGVDIMLLSLEGEPEIHSFLQTPFWESQAAFSPDGQWIAYASDESGRREVYVRPYPGPGEKVQLSNDGGEEPVWARDGKELFYRNGNRIMAVPVELGPTFAAGQSSLVFEGVYEMGLGLYTNYDVSPDGKAFLMIERTTEPPRDIHVVLNWFEELKRLVPTEN